MIDARRKHTARMRTGIVGRAHAMRVVHGSGFATDRTNILTYYLRVMPAGVQWVDVGVEVKYNVESNTSWVIE